MSTSIVEQHEKVLRVSLVAAVEFNVALGDFLGPDDNDFDSKIKADVNPDVEALANMILAHGYREEFRGTFQDQNPLELGIGMLSLQGSLKDPDDLPPSEQLPELKCPHVYSWDELLSSGEPMVARRRKTSVGMSKYLLETPEQKATFMAWAAMDMEGPGLNKLGWNKDGTIRRVPEFLDYARGLLSKAQQGQLSGSDVNHARNDKWFFQQYIPSASLHSATLRVVSDAFGNVHYGALIRSPKPKGEDVVHVQFDKHPQQWLDYIFTAPVELELVDPDGPFFLAARSMVSYVPEQSEEIIFDNQDITTEPDRSILGELGLDPDRLHLPDHIRETARRIGQLKRGETPITGIDFMIDEQHTLWGLEANTMPGLAPLAFGLAEEASHEDCEAEVLKRMFSNLK